MLPAFARLPRVAQMRGRVALLEVGPSVGLNLRLDHYRYIYRSERGTVAWGPEDATPVLVCEVRGSEGPPLPEKLEIVARHGLELAPINLDDPKALRWLRALIWPEHQERARLMDEALEVVHKLFNPEEYVANCVQSTLWYQLLFHHLPYVQQGKVDQLHNRP